MFAPLRRPNVLRMLVKLYFLKKSFLTINATIDDVQKFVFEKVYKKVYQMCSECW